MADETNVQLDGAQVKIILINLSSSTFPTAHFFNVYCKRVVLFIILLEMCKLSSKETSAT